MARIAAVLLCCVVGAAGCGQRAASERAANVLLITVDTLRADHLSGYGFSLQTSPNLDALAGEGVLFERTIAATSATAPSHASIMTSLYTRQHTIGTGNGETRLEGSTTLAELFRNAGYATAAFVSNFVLERRVGLDRGFEVYDDELPSSELNRPLMVERIAEETTARALAWLQRAERPFFLWVHLQDPHGPYRPPGPHSGHFAPGVDPGEPLLPVLKGNSGRAGVPAYQALPGLRRASEYRARYADEIFYADRWIGELLGTVGDQTIVLFTSDHGESLGEGGSYFVHGTSTLPVQAHVPLILRAPGLEAGRRSELVSHVDIMPTLLELTGIDVPDHARGLALGPYLRAGEPLPERVAYCDIGSEISAYYGDSLLRLRLTRGSRRASASKDARSWQTFLWNQTVEQVSREPDASIQRSIEGYLRHTRNTVPAPPSSSSNLERLRALGYLD
jgi:choline-sulfatase